jgi:hypothetical protein
MPDDKTPGGAPTPPRAEPIQPDRPGRGTDREPAAPGAPDASRDKASDNGADQRAEQEKAALDNVRRGYR